MNEQYFITEISIDKIRFLENISIPLSTTKRQHLILTGKNGSGKTSVINFINDIFWYILSNIRGIHIPNEAELFGREFYTSININNEPLQGKTFGWARGWRTNSVYYAFGAKRQEEYVRPAGAQPINVGEPQLSPPLGDKFLQYLVNMKVNQAFAQIEGNQEGVKKFQDWFDGFEQQLRAIFEDDELKLAFDSKQYNFSIHTKGREPFDFKTMSDGYSALLNVVTELIMQIGFDDVYSFDKQGIVLIDEIETHLHIALQKKVLPLLTTFFPNIQFIVTTHSPFVLNSIPNAVVYDLEKNILINQDLTGYSAETLIESYFDMDKYSDAIKGKLQRYENLLGQETLSDAEFGEIEQIRTGLRGLPTLGGEELELAWLQLEPIYRKKKKSMNHD